MTKLTELFSNPYVHLLLGAVLAFLFSIRIYPVLIYLGYKKNLMDKPGNRSMHTRNTPTLGGVGVFITFSLASILMGLLVGLKEPELIKLLSILGATIILLFLGIKDDLLDLSPKKKLIGQFIAAAMVVLITDVRILDFQGLFGLNEINYYVSISLSTFIFVFIINAYNLIDGIDGLATSIAIIANLAFGFYFFIYTEYFLALISAVLIGSLLGFLQYNLSENRKIFMGDSGSLFLGYLLAYQAISFLRLAETTEVVDWTSHKLILALAILSFPILDTFRVFIVRTAQGKSPFAADKNHIHHRLLNLNLKHKQVTLLVSAIQVTVILFASIIGQLDINLQFITLCLVVPSLFLIPFLIKKEIQDEPKEIITTAANSKATIESKISEDLSDERVINKIIDLEAKKLYDEHNKRINGVNQNVNSHDLGTDFKKRVSDTRLLKFMNILKPKGEIKNSDK